MKLLDLNNEFFILLIEANGLDKRDDKLFAFTTHKQKVLAVKIKNEKEALSLLVNTAKRLADWAAFGIFDNTSKLEKQIEKALINIQVTVQGKQLIAYFPDIAWNADWQTDAFDY